MGIENAIGAFLVNTARSTVRKFLTDESFPIIYKKYPNVLDGNAGVFATINKLVGAEKELRGCTGSTRPDRPLIENVPKVAIAAAIDDPRFTPVSEDELDSIIFEVSMPTPAEQVTTETHKDLPTSIKVGKDGLIVTCSFGSGLLLPQVPAENGWNEEEFLEYACMKAGATPDIWLIPDTKIYKFQAIVFGETSPRGKVERKVLT